MGVAFLKAKNWQIYLFFVLMTSFTVLFFQNCDKYQSEKAKKPLLSSSTPPVSCKVQPSITTPFEENSIQINESLLGGAGIQSSSDSATQTPSEIEVGLVVDPLCVSQSEGPILVLGQVIGVPSELNHLNRAAISLTFEIPIDLDQLTQDMEQSPCLIGVSENQTVTFEQARSSSTTSEVNDPAAEDQAHLDFVKHSESMDLQNGITAPVVVAVIGTGIDEGHPDLQGRLWNDGQGNHGKNFDVDENTPTPDSTDLSDANGFGTHVAGLIAAKQNNNIGTVGLNGDFVRVMVVKVESGNGSTAGEIYNGIQYAIGSGADVITVGYSIVDPEAEGGRNTLLDQAVTEAVNAGLVVTMVAGRSENLEVTSSRCPSPGCVGPDVDGALAVASVDASTGSLSDFSDFSSSFVEIAAPGSEKGKSKGLLSTTIDSNWSRGYGVSRAASVVASASAFLIGYLKTNNITYTPASVETFLKDKGSHKSSFIQSSVQEGRVIDFGLLSQNIKNLYQNDNSNQGCL